MNCRNGCKPGPGCWDFGRDTVAATRMHDSLPPVSGSVTWDNSVRKTTVNSVCCRAEDLPNTVPYRRETVTDLQNDDGAGRAYRADGKRSCDRGGGTNKTDRHWSSSVRDDRAVCHARLKNPGQIIMVGTRRERLKYAQGAADALVNIREEDAKSALWADGRQGAQVVLMCDYGICV